MAEVPTLLERALRIAVEAHHGQVRKTDGSPYIIHPVSVALKLAQHGFGQEVIAAALVHDVLEDTKFPQPQLRQELGEEIWQLVASVTEDKSLSWEERKAWDVQTVRDGSEAVKAIMVADRIHNLEGLLMGHATLGPALWATLTRGREAQLQFFSQLLRAWQQTWQHPLVDEYEALLKRVESLS